MIIEKNSIIHGEVVTLWGEGVKKYTVLFGSAFDSSDGIFSFGGI